MGGVQPLSASERVTKIEHLPDWYNPNVDGGRMAVELFLDWAEPPERVEIRKDEDGKNVAIAYGGAQMDI